MKQGVSKTDGAMSALAFAVGKLIEEGKLDRHVLQLSMAAHDRLQILKAANKRSSIDKD